MAKYKGLPLYQGLVDEEGTGMFCISLVESPATESDFIYFSEVKEPVFFSVEDRDRQIVRGLLMAADYPIYRRNGNYEYYITYSAETLRKMAEKYLKEGFSSNVDLEHNGVPVEGVDMTQIFIKDVANGINPKGFEEYKDGSLFVEFHISNNEIWEQIKDGNFKGFSLAGVFEISENFNIEVDNNKTNNNAFMKINRIKEALKKILAQFGSIATDKGTLVWDGDDDLKEGDAVRAIDEEGNEIAAEDGEYRTEDRKIIVVADGKVAEIKDDEAEVAPEAPESEDEGEGENEEPAAEEAAEEEPAAEDENEPEQDDRDERIANLEAEIARLEEENGALKERIKELEGEPAADSAAEQFKKEEKKNSKIEALRSRGYKL